MWGPAQIFEAFYDVHLSKKAIQDAVRTTAFTLKPHHTAIQDRILEGDFVNGDETTWRVMGLPYWVWCVVGADAVWFNIQDGRDNKKAKIMLPGYEGGVGSDSWGAWNHVGKWHQKCHLHYKTDLKKTIEDNKSAEFQTFAKQLRKILWDSHTPQKGRDHNDDTDTRRRKQRNLLRRLRYIMNKPYTDKDCKRYLKRLRREFYHLFSHIIHPIDWHNNVSERAVRCFVLLRHIMHGNRTKKDSETYAILLSIIGTCAMRGANPIDYMVNSLSRGSPVELPRPPTPRQS